MIKMFKPSKKRKSEPVDEEEVEIMAPKNKFHPVTEEMQAEEAKLTDILFGGASSFLKSLQEAETEPGKSRYDSGIGETDSDDSNKVRQAAWEDEEDDGIDVGMALDTQCRRLPDGGINKRTNKYSDLLKTKFTSINGTPKWASLDKKEEADSDEEILQTCAVTRKIQTTYLSPNTIEFKKVKDLNGATYTEGTHVNSIEFHPSSTVALVAGNACVASLFAVDGKQNNKLHSIKFNKFPILCAKFTTDGNEVILGSRQSFIHSYDLIAAKATKICLPKGVTHAKYFVVSPDGKYIMIAGKFGEIHTILATTKEEVFQLKQNSEVTSLAFNSTGSILMGHSDVGEVTVWDVNARRVIHKWEDEGCLQGSALDISPSNQYLATGSEQGVVNLYDFNTALQNKTPKPKKSALNLTTGVSQIKFNATSEILAFSSPHIDNSLRLMHVGSQTIFQNFPTYSTKLGHINSLNFSPNGGYLAFGNKDSVASLYRLKHFKSY